MASLGFEGWTERPEDLAIRVTRLPTALRQGSLGQRPEPRQARLALQAALRQVRLALQQVRLAPQAVLRQVRPAPQVARRRVRLVPQQVRLAVLAVYRQRDSHEDQTPALASNKKTAALCAAVCSCVALPQRITSTIVWSLGSTRTT
jgi:hypothetical protein